MSLMRVSHNKLYIAALAITLFGCRQTKNTSTMQEVQLTTGLYGHMLNSNQVFSPDDKWVVYDTRNDQTHISRTCCIEMANVHTGEIVKLYQAPDQTLHGPGVGAAAWHPLENRIIFIHGLLNCNESNPYSFTRRFGAILDTSSPFRIRAAESRTIDFPLIAGALRGGTHAHSWSGDGKWISFTYNDFLMEQLELKSGGKIRDLRTIGVMSPARSVQIAVESGENFSGNYISAVAATVKENPGHGTDEIEKAFDECWIGRDGYVKKNGPRQKRAVAFQGHVRTKNGSLMTEIFVADVPEDITRAAEGHPLEGTLTSRPEVPSGLEQRRLTFTGERKYPGLQGPRFWLRSSPDGSFIYFLMKDEEGIVQIFEVSVNGGDIRKITSLPASVQSQFNLSPDGKALVAISDNSIWKVGIESGEGIRLTEKTSDDDAPQLTVNWNHSGDMLVYNRYVGSGKNRYLQIFKIGVD